MEETSKEANARRELDNKKLRVFGRGQISGLIFGISALLTTCFLGYNHESTTASIVGGTTIVAIVIAFVTGKK